jgi:hypothetical protein
MAIGTTLEEFVRLAPQTADEIYNEFDFTDPSTPHTDVVTVSYGEPFSGDDAIDFWPFMERAERLARFYPAYSKPLERPARSLDEDATTCAPSLCSASRKYAA